MWGMGKGLWVGKESGWGESEREREAAATGRCVYPIHP